MRRSDARTVGLVTSGQTPTIIALVLPFYLIMVLRGSLLQAMAFLTVLVVCVAVVRVRPSRADIHRHTLPDQNSRSVASVAPVSDTAAR